MPPRGSRGKPRPPRIAPREEATVHAAPSAELLDSLLDESERPTVRMPSRPPLAPPEDGGPAPAENREVATVRKRVSIGPDGIPRMDDPDVFEEATRPFIPPKTLLAGKVRKKRGAG